LLAPDAHQRLGGRDLANPRPQRPFPAVRSDALHHFEERLLEHVLGLFGMAQHPPGEVVDGRLEGSIQCLERLQIAGSGPGHEDVGGGERDGHLLPAMMPWAAEASRREKTKGVGSGEWYATGDDRARAARRRYTSPR